MNRIERLHPTGVTVVIGAVLGAVALAGCGAGQITQTSSQVAAVGGANAGNAEMEVRDARIEFAENAKGGNIYGQGTDAPLSMSIINSGIGADRLVSATSPAAESVEISGELEVPGGQVLRVEGEPPAATGAAAAPSATSAEPAPTGAALAPSDEKLGENSGGTQDEADGQGASPEEAPGVPVTSAPGASAPASASGSAEPSAAAGTGVLGPRREAQIVFSGLREDVRAGLTYPLVLTFERAGQITLDVPVANSDEPREDEPAE